MLWSSCIAVATTSGVIAVHPAFASQRFEDATAPLQRSFVAQTPSAEDRLAEADRFLQQGIQQYGRSPFREALQSWQMALELYRETGVREAFPQESRQGEGNSLGNLGIAYRSLGQYQRAIDHLEQQLVIVREIGDRHGEGVALGNLGIAYASLGQYQRAVGFFEQALVIAREIGDRRGEGAALDNLGIAYSFLGQYQRAVGSFEQALVIAREIGDQLVESNILGDLGIAYRNLGQYQQAINFSEQALVIVREIGYREGEGNALGNLGSAYVSVGQYQRAIAYYQQALGITQEIGDRAGESSILNNIGRLLAQQNQPELAIVFLKQSVNVRESIRGDIRGLSQELQQSYTETIADDYRALADLLLQQNRILEAQRVLDLLKVQELDDYLQNVRRTAQTQSGVDLLNPEVEIRNRTVAIGYELADLRAIPYAQLTNQQRQRIAQLNEAQRTIINDFQGFINSPEIQALIAQLDADIREQDVLAELDEFINLQNNCGI